MEMLLDKFRNKLLSPEIVANYTNAIGTLSSLIQVSMKRQLASQDLSYFFLLSDEQANTQANVRWKFNFEGAFEVN